MGLPLISGCLWLILANVLALLPERPGQWRLTYLLIGIGIPILGWVTWTSGPVWGFVFLLGGASVLRWPLVQVLRVVRDSR